MYIGNQYIYILASFKYGVFGIRVYKYWLAWKISKAKASFCERNKYYKFKLNLWSGNRIILRKD